MGPGLCGLPYARLAPLGSALDVRRQFEEFKLRFSLEPLSQPAALLSRGSTLWYNDQFRARLLGGGDLLISRVNKVLPGLELQLCRTPEGQLLTLGGCIWAVHSSTVPGGAESMSLLIFNEETALRRVEAEYKASRPGCLIFSVDGYDDVFGDMLDGERARLLEGINRTLEDMIGRGTGFLRRIGTGRYLLWWRSAIWSSTPKKAMMCWTRSVR